MNLIIIRRPRQIIALSEDEILEMLRGRTDLWAIALKRGKGVLRFERGQARKGKGDRPP
ncbi:hypothetical protein M7775_05950 [Sporomusa sphaeroides DSM 2875]|uniref:hypothetical protein n=1 Tax=Sporomusa sphaeroides TaxID=47679 RepID=UPI00202F3DF1|nr:hypothetical protein [Sporomusa sphaeroides]MCM0758118.1 hypothetical protein [Sporomusa sphaeroides DSM 2875]